MNTQDEIERFLALRRIAVVGVSASATDPSRILMRALREYGLDAVPVRPGVLTIEDRLAYASVFDVPALEAAVIVTPPRFDERVIEDCAAAGAKLVWLDPGGLHGVTADTLATCDRLGLRTLVGNPPLAALERRHTVPSSRWRRLSLGWFSHRAA